MNNPKLTINYSTEFVSLPEPEFGLYVWTTVETWQATL